jgi:hypothetical protein
MLPCGWTYVCKGARLPLEMAARREAWQKAHNLVTPWLSEKADRYILSAHTGITIGMASGSATVGHPPPPEPPFQSIDDPAALERYYMKEYHPKVYEPWRGRSRVQTIESPYHLEWVVIRQCEAVSYEDIASKYAARPKWHKAEPGLVQETLGIKAKRKTIDEWENLNKDTVEKGAKSAAEVIQLPLLSLPRGRKRKNS